MTAGAAGYARRALRGDEALGQALAREEARAVYARPDARRRDTEGLGDLGILHALDVVQDQGGSIVGRQGLERVVQSMAQLTLQLGRLDSIRPVAHRLEMKAAAVERGQHLVERCHLGRLSPGRGGMRQKLAVRLARGEPVDPGPEV